MPRPPHTVSRSAPNRRAASSTVVPCATVPLRPDGVKTMRCSTPLEGAGKASLPSPTTALTPSACALAGGRVRIAVGTDPDRAVLVGAHQHVGGEHGRL